MINLGLEVNQHDSRAYSRKLCSVHEKEKCKAALKVEEGICAKAPSAQSCSENSKQLTVGKAILRCGYQQMAW